VLLPESSTIAAAQAVTFARGGLIIRSAMALSPVKTTNCMVKHNIFDI
jgi:hypothetical protein